MHKAAIRGDTIRLDQFLKWIGIVATGGHAKALIQEGCILVNGNVEIHRGRKLKIGDEISILSNNDEIVYKIMGDNEDAP